METNSKVTIILRGNIRFSADKTWPGQVRALFAAGAAARPSAPIKRAGRVYSALHEAGELSQGNWDPFGHVGSAQSIAKIIAGN